MTKKVSDSAQQKQQWQIIVEKWQKQEKKRKQSKDNVSEQNKKIEIKSYVI
jgi:hypoxanthine phosphoribosyltransferase